MISSLTINAAARLLTTYRELEEGNPNCPSGADEIVRRIGELQGLDQGNIEKQLNELFPEKENADSLLFLLREIAKGLLHEQATGSWVLDAISQIQRETRLNLPVSLLLATCLADSDGGSAFPFMGTFVNTDSALRSLIDSGLADGHVHIGAGVPFLALFALAADGSDRAERERPIIRSVGAAVDRPRFVSIDSRLFRPDIILIAAKIIMRLLLEFVLSSERKPFKAYLTTTDIIYGGDGAREEILSGRFWKKVAKAADISHPRRRTGPAFSVAEYLRGEPDGASSLMRAFAGRMDTSDVERFAFESVVRMLKHHYQYPEDEDYAIHLTQLVRCICMMHRAVTPKRPTLYEFIRHFVQQGRLRDVSGMPRSQLVELGLRYMARTRHLKQLELRTSISPFHTSDAFYERSLLRECAGYLKSYLDYLDSDGRNEPKTVFAFSFVRTKREDIPRVPDLTEEGTRPLCWKFEHIWVMMEAISELYIDHPGIEQLFHTIDIAGDEDDLANWIFCILAQGLQKRIRERRTGRLRVPIEFTIHAGESFSNPLQGLRHVGEVLEHMPKGTRVGHGLALGGNLFGAHQGFREGEVKQELLDDLTWAWQKLTGHLKNEVEQVQWVLARELYEEPVDPHALLEAYELRFDAKTLEKLGVFVTGKYSGCIDKHYLESRNIVYRVLARYLTDDRGNQLHPLDEALRKLIREAYRELLPDIKSRLRVAGTIIELCPTSNLTILGIPSYMEHPIFELTQSGANLAVTINTDDPGIFHVTISDEYAAIWNASSERKLGTPEERKAWLDQIRIRGIENIAGNIRNSDMRREITQCLEILDS